MSPRSLHEVKNNINRSNMDGQIEELLCVLEKCVQATIECAPVRTTRYFGVPRESARYEPLYFGQQPFIQVEDSWSKAIFRQWYNLPCDTVAGGWRFAATHHMNLAATKSADGWGSI